MNPHRAVALRLAGLALADRRWLLERLPAVDRARVLEAAPTAERLRAADPDQCARWLRQLAHGAQQAQVSLSQASVDALDCAPLAAIAPLLEPLPLAAQAEVLRAGPWRWKLGFLERLSETQRQALSASPEPAMRPAALQALLEAMAAALRRDAQAGQPFETWLGA